MNDSHKSTKKGIVFSNWFKLLVFALVLISLFFQLKNVNWNDTKGLEIKYLWALLLSAFLLSVNLGFEFLKWKFITNPLRIESKFVKNSFWAGIASGFMSPNGWGNFLGRVIYFQRRDKIYIIFATALANLSQLIPTLIFGFIAMFSYTTTDTRGNWGYIVIATLLIVSLYFFADGIIPSKKSKHKLIRQLQFIRGRYNQLKLVLLFYSTLRFLVFSLQYVLLFVCFGYTDFWFLLNGVWMIYLLTSFVPSLWSGKVLIRETAALFVFQNSMVTVPDILVASILIYMINIALPAFMSSFIWLPKKS